MASSEIVVNRQPIRLDHTTEVGGRNHALEKIETAPVVLAKGETKMLVTPRNVNWISDTASFSWDGATLLISRTDYDDAPPPFAIMVEVNGIKRELCPQHSGPSWVPHGPAEGTRFFVSRVHLALRPGDRVTITDPTRDATAAVTLG